MTQRTDFHLTLPVSSVDHTLGPDHAPVTLVEYGDFECPNCKQAAPAVKLLLERVNERVRFVYRIPMRSSPPKRPSARARRASSGRCTSCCLPTRST